MAVNNELHGMIMETTWLTFLVTVAMVLTFGYCIWLFIKAEFGDKVNLDPKSFIARIKGE